MATEWGNESKPAATIQSPLGSLDHAFLHMWTQISLKFTQCLTNHLSLFYYLRYDGQPTCKTLTSSYSYVPLLLANWKFVQCISQNVFCGQKGISYTSYCHWPQLICPCIVSFRLATELKHCYCLESL